MLLRVPWLGVRRGAALLSTQSRLRCAFLGPPGAGKGTYAQRVCPDLGLAHVSTGDLVRAEINEGSALGKEMAELTAAGQLVPDDRVLALLSKHLTGMSGGFVLDGYPRNIAQAKSLAELVNLDLVVHFDIPQEIIVEKTIARRVCSNSSCGANYNIAHIKYGDIDMPPLAPKIDGVCDKCGSDLIQRPDDTEAVVLDRLRIYADETAPLIDFYHQQGILKHFLIRGSVNMMLPELEAIMAHTK